MSKYPWRLSILFYITAWSPTVLFLDARFWDDWYVFYLFDEKESELWWQGEGFPTYVYQVQALFLRRNPFVYHALSLTCNFLVSWLFYRVLEKYRFFGSKINSKLALLLLILPVNSARVAMIMLPYTVSFLLFFIAWNLWLSNNRLVRAVSLGVFLLSFYTWSLLPMILLVAVSGVIRKLKEEDEFQFHHLNELFVAGIAPAYWLIARRVWPVAQNRLDYFTPQVNGLARAFLVGLLGLGLAVWLYRKVIGGMLNREKFFLVVAGIAALWLGSIAYFASGRLVDLSEWLSFVVPNQSDWSSRSQLLHGVGIAMIVIGCLTPDGRNVGSIAWRVIVGICLVLNLSILSGYVLDDMKQDAVVREFSRNDVIQKAEVILIDDRQSLNAGFNARGRGLRSWEWEALYYYATGVRKKFLISYDFNCSSSDSVPNIKVTLNPQVGRLRSWLNLRTEINLITEQVLACTS